MTTSTIRLHITPLDPDLLETVLGPTSSKLATNISFHTLQTFPEVSYGYLDLPNMEAERIKKKINGSILRGKRVKVEEARPRKRKHSNEENNDVEAASHTLDNTEKVQQQPKFDRNQITGREISPERKIKRGWTDSQSKSSKPKAEKSNTSTKSQAKSKYTNQDELLFALKVPKNKSQPQSQEKRQQKKRNAGAVEIVHEFEKSISIPTFLRSEASGDKSASKYEDGTGWVDDNGNVVEEESPRIAQLRNKAHESQPKRTIRERRAKLQEQRISHAKNNPVALSTTSEPAAPDADLLSTRDANDQDGTTSSDTDDTSSSGSSQSDEASGGTSESEAGSESDSKSTKDIAMAKPSTATADTGGPSVHPLEALFKKPAKPASSQATINSQDIAKPSLEVQTSFSFFEQRGDDENLPPMPMTPFSSQDLRTREMRSAAPTPDTAYPSRKGSIFNGEDSTDEDDDDEEEPGEEQHENHQEGTSQSLQVPQTDFEKQFWEKRGENNRAWKSRRRAVLKEKRQRENRARRPKNW